MFHILLGVLLAGLVVLVAASIRPSTVHYVRSIVINAEGERILAHIDDLRRWTAWSPWEGEEPLIRRRYSGADRGVGAQYSWANGEKAGTGAMEIVAVTAAEVKVDWLFRKPWKSRCITLFRTTREADGTRLTWSMEGAHPYMSKVFSLFMDMEAMIGKDLERGLQAIKALAEGPALDPESLDPAHEGALTGTGSGSRASWSR